MVVAAVPVAFTKVKFWRVDEALAKRLVKVPRPEEVKLPPVPVVKNKLVVEAVVEKREVEVALELVELTAVKFCKVEEPLTKRLTKVAEPAEREAENRLVEEAVVLKRLVVVAFVPVALVKVNFCKVVEPTTNKSPAVLMVEVAVPPILN